MQDKIQALEAAIIAGNADEVNKLIGEGVDISSVRIGEEQLSPLIYAVQNKLPEVVEALLVWNVLEVDVMDADRNTALGLAVATYQIEVVRVLLDAGANMKAAGLLDNQGKVDRALYSPKDGSKKIAALEIGKLLQTSLSNITELTKAAKIGNLEMVKDALSYIPGKAVDMPDGKGLNALERAAIGGHMEVVKYLLDYGASMKASHLLDENGDMVVGKLNVNGTEVELNEDIKRVLQEKALQESFDKPLPPPPVYPSIPTELPPPPVVGGAVPPPPDLPPAYTPSVPTDLPPPPLVVGGAVPPPSDLPPVYTPSVPTELPPPPPVVGGAVPPPSDLPPVYTPSVPTDLPPPPIPEMLDIHFPMEAAASSISTANLDDINKAKKYVAIMQHGTVIRDTASQDEVRYKPSRIQPGAQEIEGADEFNALNANGEIRKMNINVIIGFKSSLNRMIGDRGRDTAEYARLISSIDGLLNSFSADEVTDAKDMQTKLNRLQLQIGQFYASNPALQQHVSIRNFFTLVGRDLATVVESLNMRAEILYQTATLGTATGHGRLLTSAQDFMLVPVLSSIASGKMELHDSAVKNALDSKYLAEVKESWVKRRNSPEASPMRDIDKAIGKFSVALDRFKLAQLINENPDAVVRYLKDVQSKKLPANDEEMRAAAALMDVLASGTTKKNMQYIVDQLDKTEEKGGLFWEYLAVPFINSVEEAKRGIDSLMGYDKDIRDAFTDFAVVYEAYGSLFKTVEESRIGRETKGFAAKVFKKSEIREKEAVTKGFRDSIDALIDDNGRRSPEFRTMLVEIAKLEILIASQEGKRANKQYVEQLQTSLNNIAKASANLYASNSAVQQGVSIREFSEGVAKGMSGLVNDLNDKVKLHTTSRVHDTTRRTFLQTLASQSDEKLNAYGSKARKIEAYDYLTELKGNLKERGADEKGATIQAVDKLINRFDQRDNFKLAGLINKDPERVVRALAGIDGNLLPNMREDSVEKITMVLNYLSSDKTKENLDKIVDGLNREAPKPEPWTLESVAEFFTDIITAMARGLDVVTGFDQDLKEAFRELNNITALNHDIIKEKVEAQKEVPTVVKEDRAQAFVDRIAKRGEAGEITR